MFVNCKFTCLGVKVRETQVFMEKDKAKQVGILAGTEATEVARLGVLCCRREEEGAGHLEEMDALRFVAAWRVAATFLVILWKTPAVAHSNRRTATECNRLTGLSVFAAINKLLFHKLSFNVFCRQKEQASRLKILIKILSCFGKVLLFSNIRCKVFFLARSLFLESYS